METLLSETSVTSFLSTNCNIPEDSDTHQDLGEDFKIRCLTLEGKGSTIRNVGNQKM
jgi:hypothetical protein